MDFAFLTIDAQVNFGELIGHYRGCMQELRCLASEDAVVQEPQLAYFWELQQLLHDPVETDRK